MKVKYALLVAWLFAVCLVGCSSDTEVADTQPQLASKTTSLQMQAFLLSVDSLNAQYPERTSRADTKTIVASASADMAGRLAGGKIGWWAGQAIGSVTGNPVVVIAGGLVGRKFGPSICSGLASSLTKFVMNNRSRRATCTFDSLSVRANYNISQFGEIGEDSLGYIHNYIMARVSAEESKYYKGDTIDVRLLYDDVVLCCIELGLDAAQFQTNRQLKQQIVCLVKGISEISEEYEQGHISVTEFTNRQSSLLQTRCSLNDDELLLFKEFSSKLVFKCSQLTEKELDEYSIKLDSIIKTSDLTMEQKRFVASSGQIAINSALCW